MNKQTYLAKLAQLLAPLPEQERQDALKNTLTPQARKLKTSPPTSWATPPTLPAKFWRARA